MCPNSWLFRGWVAMSFILPFSHRFWFQAQLIPFPHFILCTIHCHVLSDRETGVVKWEHWQDPEGSTPFAGNGSASPITPSACQHLKIVTISIPFGRAQQCRSLYSPPQESPTPPPTARGRVKVQSLEKQQQQPPFCRLLDKFTFCRFVAGKFGTCFWSV